MLINLNDKMVSSAFQVVRSINHDKQASPYLTYIHQPNFDEIIIKAVELNKSSVSEHNYLKRTFNNGDEIVMSYDKYGLCAFEYTGRRYILKKSIVLSPIEDDGMFYVSFCDLGIEICENTINDALESFYEEFDFLYRNYVQCEDTELTKGAIKLKNTILSYVGEVVYLEHFKNERYNK